MSDRPSLTVVAEPTDPETDKLVTSGFGLNNSLTSYNYQLFTIQLERDNDESLGIHLTDSLVVCSVNRENVDVLFGDLWLELDGVPLKNKRHFAKLYFKMTDKPKSRVILKLKIARLICRFKLQDDEIKKLPVDVTATNRHFKYHKALVYGIPGMR
uniref:PDZ domain-containing protein n=1 Tax=Panagrolaimus sp. JU765 TaxID=591449 RepID=A0AC34R9G9_9BILA